MGLFDRFKNQDSGQEFFVIAGLGNPGQKYEGTKHNVGFDVVDRLAKKHHIDVTKFKNKALIGDGTIGGRRVLLIKPQTFMNLSGDSISEIVNFYKIPQERFVVIFDDTSLPVGSLRIREKGSAGGHNGIKSIISRMGTDEFCRIKVGIGEKPNGWDLADYVLAKFDKDDLPLLESGLDKSVEAVELILSHGVMDAMNRVNQRSKPSKKENRETKISETSKVEEKSAVSAGQGAEEV